MSEAPAGWLRAIDEALVAAHIGVASESDDFETARKNLNALIDWHVQVALDPAVNGGRHLVPDNENEPALWVWQYSAGTFSSVTFKNRRACELSTLPNVPGQPVALYLHPPTFHTPEPMTQRTIFGVAMATLTRIQRNDWTAKYDEVIEFARAIETEVLRRVREVNK